MEILNISNLDVCFDKNCPVKNVNLTLKKGEILGIVGESGSGKTLTALSIMGLLPYPKAQHSKKSSIKYHDIELLNNPNINNIRGNRIGIVFQEPMSSLNPLHKIGKQIAETLITHRKISTSQAQAETIDLLKLCGIKNATQKINAYPHELSGGQRQRVMIAMAIANKPDILIADEPTTALDVTVQEQIIELLLDLRQKLDMSIIFISHDLRLINRIADSVAIMKDGKIIEQGKCHQIFNQPQHNYTKTLIESHNILIKKDKTSKTLVSLSNIEVKFPQQKNFFGHVSDYLKAVDNVSIDIMEGQTIGIIGESGSGKTTLGQALCKLIPFKGGILTSGEIPQNWHKFVQIVFQDPYNSLNPRMNIEEIVGEGLLVHFPNLSAQERRKRIIDVLKEVGLSPNIANRYPHEFSGGQRQRIAIARALIVEPSLIVLDEPTSALDVTIQAQILKLLNNIQEKKGISYLFISHNMQAIKAISHQIAVMKDGRIIEIGSAEQVFNNPKHSYTQQLIKASLL
ncbi:MAG: ABC transporter ATP-binding protein [Alphaproteobacteria bacterium]|nr:ABC transporter ATP-binding protein [Alphaproteobacteria bacterium]